MSGFLHTHLLGEPHESRSTLPQAHGERDSCGLTAVFRFMISIVPIFGNYTKSQLYRRRDLARLPNKPGVGSEDLIISPR
jgi:hypothetical protein